MADSLVKALAYNDEVRVYAINATEMVEKARSVQDSWSVATAALGRTMIASTMLGATLKDEKETLTVRVQGDGPVGGIIVDTNMYGETKGYLQNPHVALDLNEAGHLDVKGAVGTQGALTITKDLGMKRPFVGQVPLVSGELAEDFTYYMAVSEQTPSSFGLSVLVNPDESVQAAGGFMIQVLPDVQEETIDQIEEALENMTPISQLLAEDPSVTNLLDHLVGADNYRILEEMPVSFECGCSKERFAESIIALGKEEIQAMIDEDGGAEAECHFCRSKYVYTIEELEELKEEAAE